MLVYARDDEFRKTITTSKAAFVIVYNRSEQKERVQASHMGCQERAKVSLKIPVIRGAKWDKVD